MPLSEKSERDEQLSYGADSGSGEQFDDRVRKAAELTERWRYWCGRERLTTRQRYLDGETRIGIRRVGVDPRQDGFVFGALLDREFVGPDHSEIMPAQREIKIAMCGKQLPVLSRNVHLMEGIEHVVPSLVWRETFDSRAVLSRKPLYLFKSAVPRIDELIDAPADGKIRVFAVREAVARGESYRENIKAAADAVDDDASLNVDDGWDVNGEILDGILAHLRIELSDKGIRHWLTPGFNPALGDFELGYGPINSSFWFS